MSRRRKPEKRVILPDPQYKNLIVAKFTNNVMEDGKKSIAEKIVYGAFDIVIAKMKVDPVAFFLEALEQVKPKLEVKSRRVGGATYQVPVEVSAVRAEALAMRWIIKAAKSRGDRTMAEKLANELMDAHTLRGGAAKKKDDTHKMADANKAFAHYRW